DTPSPSARGLACAAAAAVAATAALVCKKPRRSMAILPRTPPPRALATGALCRSIKAEHGRHRKPVRARPGPPARRLFGLGAQAGQELEEVVGTPVADDAIDFAAAQHQKGGR